jgi:hypothetical protein
MTRVPPLPTERLGRRAGLFVAAVMSVGLGFAVGGVTAALSPTLVPLCWYFGGWWGRRIHISRRLLGSGPDRFAALMDEIDQAAELEFGALRVGRQKDPKALLEVYERRRTRIGDLEQEYRGGTGPFALPSAPMGTTTVQINPVADIQPVFGARDFSLASSRSEAAALAAGSVSGDAKQAEPAALAAGSISGDRNSPGLTTSNTVPRFDSSRQAEPAALSAASPADRTR